MLKIYFAFIALLVSIKVAFAGSVQSERTQMPCNLLIPAVNFNGFTPSELQKNQLFNSTQGVMGVAVEVRKLDNGFKIYTGNINYRLVGSRIEITGSVFLENGNYEESIKIFGKNPEYYCYVN